MKNISIITLFAITLICNSVYAETVKSTKNIKSSDKNQTMTDDEFVKRFMALDQEIKKDQAEIDNERAKTAEMRKKTTALKKLEKTVDELGKQLGIDKQK